VHVPAGHGGERAVGAPGHPVKGGAGLEAEGVEGDGEEGLGVLLRAAGSDGGVGGRGLEPRRLGVWNRTIALNQGTN
jgi:hypothetical protein